MRSISIKVVLFFCLIFSILHTGCFSESTQEKFILDSFTWNDVPSNIQNQIEGAGCEYTSQNNESSVYMINGLVRINGIYEILSEKQVDSPDYTKQVYENSRWIIYVDISNKIPDNNQENGTLTLRSKEKDGNTTIQIQRFCGT